jgi:hypothetical protein
MSEVEALNWSSDSTDKPRKESRAMSERTNETIIDNRHEMTEQAFAIFGGGKIAYVKSIRSEDVHRLYPQAPELEPGMALFALHAADGTPIMVTDTREAAVANAMTHELETVSVH